MSFKPSTKAHLDDLLTRKPELSGLRDDITQAVSIICDSHKSGGKVLACGNGGSAADAEHIVGELMKSFILPRKLSDQDVEKLEKTGCVEMAGNLQQGVAAVALTGHPSLSTAILNDTDPYMAFAQQVYVLGRPGDVFLGISTSGNAANVINAAKVAKAFGLCTIGFTGAKDSKLSSVCDITIKAPETETYRIQEYHLPVYHTICLMVENELFGESDGMPHNTSDSCAGRAP